MKIHIPNPCQEDWNQMSTEEKGRFCKVCSKTVVDFTGWEPEAISSYLMERKNEQVCGHFTAGQLYNTLKPEAFNWPSLIAASGLSFLRKVAAVIVVVFGLSSSSCNDGTIDGEPLLVDTVKAETSISVEDTLMEKPAPPEIIMHDGERKAADSARSRKAHKHL